MPDIVRLRAHAKINLYLRVGPPRRDGYHGIVTLFQSISLADELTVRMRRGSGLSLKLTDRRIPADDSNTVAKAHRWLCRNIPRARRFAFDVRVKKRIPSGAGLGGASADAAGFIHAACRLLKTKIPSDMVSLVREVGADVPFCVMGATAIGRGLGERLTRIAPLPSAPVWIRPCSLKVSTPDAYRLLDSRKNPSLAGAMRDIRRIVADLRAGRPPSVRVNDFEPPVFRRHARLARRSKKFSARAWTLMTGSGSAMILLPRAASPGLPDRKLISARFISTPVTWL